MVCDSHNQSFPGRVRPWTPLPRAILWKNPVNLLIRNFNYNELSVLSYFFPWFLSGSLATRAPLDSRALYNRVANPSLYLLGRETVSKWQSPKAHWTMATPMTR